MVLVVVSTDSGADVESKGEVVGEGGRDDGVESDRHSETEQVNGRKRVKREMKKEKCGK